MKTFHEYVKQQENLLLKGAGSLVSGGVGASLGLGAGMIDALKRALKGGKNFALSTATDGKYGDHDDQGNPKFQKKMKKKL